MSPTLSTTPRWITWKSAALATTLATTLALAIAVRQSPLEAQTPVAAAASAEFFEARVRPLLVAQCYECHDVKANGGLRVDSRETLLTGGDSGPAIVPGDPDKSLLIQAVRRQPNAPQMPSKRPKLRDDLM